MLVKPQFELQPEQIGKGGLVKRRGELRRWCASASRRRVADSGLALLDYFESAITGGDGNREFLVFARRRPEAAAVSNPHILENPMGLPVSFEFFPPKTPEGAEKLRAVRQQLYALKPEFCSVTYGAGGSTQEGTFDTVREILAEGGGRGLALLVHRRHQGHVREQLATLKAMGVKRLVALRGDLPSGYGAGRRVPLRQRPGGLHPRRDRATTSTSRWRPTPRCTRRRSRPRPICRPT